MDFLENSFRRQSAVAKGITKGGYNRVKLKTENPMCCSREESG